MVWTWLGIVLFLIFIEAATAGLVTIWFVASGIVAMVLSIFVDNYLLQFGVFVLLGVLLLVTTRKSLLRLLGDKTPKTNLDRVVGMTAIVTKEISKNNPGEVKVDGKYWTAVSDKKISIDSTVKVLKIDGVKLSVEEVDE